MTVPSPPNGKLASWLRFLATVSSLFIIPLLIWGISVEVRLSTIEVTRFDSADGLALIETFNAHLVRQASVDTLQRANIDEVARELNRLRQDIREAIEKMDRYHTVRNGADE